MLNIWGTDPTHVNGDEFCPFCERETPGHYTTCPTRTEVTMSHTEHPRPFKGANPSRAHAERERRRSNAAGTHGDRRTRRLRSRAAIRHAAIREES